MARVRTLQQAAAWVDRVGLALLFPKADVVLPSLWEQVNGSPQTAGWTKELEFLWGAKDELPARGLVCVGKHLRRVATCVAPPVLPALVAAQEVPVLEGLELAVADAVRENGPLTAPQLRGVLGLEKKETEKAISSLHRQLVLTHAHLVEQEGPWGALAHDLLARKWKLPKRLPAPEDARRRLAGIVLDSAGELTGADLGGALGWRRKAAEAALDEIAESREEEGFRIWTRP